MRLTGLTVAIVALAFASCSKPNQTEEPPAATPAPIATPARAENISQAPPPTTPAPATPSPAPQLAPEGVFYLIAAARVETPDGIRGLPPGTGVKLVRPGVY